MEEQLYGFYQFPGSKNRWEEKYINQMSQCTAWHHGSCFCLAWFIIFFKCSTLESAFYCYLYNLYIFLINILAFVLLMEISLVN